MSEQEEKGKGFLSQKLGDYAVEPPEKVWETISGRLRGRNRRSIWIVSLSAAAAIALAVTFGIRFYAPFSGNQMALEDEVAGQVGPVSDPMQERLAPAPMQEGLAPDPMQEDAASADGDEGIAPAPMQEGLAPDPMQEDAAPAPMQEGLAPDPGEEGIAPAPGEEAETTPPVIRDERTRIRIALNPVGPLPGDPVRIRPEPVAEAGIGDPGMSPSGIDPNAGQPGYRPESFADGNVPSDGDLRTEGPEGADREDAFGRERVSRWQVGAALSPIYSYRDAESTAYQGMPDHESGVVSYAGGLRVSYAGTDRLAIESGLLFSKMGISIGASGIQLAASEMDFSPIGPELARSNEVVAITNSVGNIVSKEGDIYVNNYMLNANGKQSDHNDFQTNDVLAEEGIRQHLEYLEFPLNLRYTVIERDIELQLIGGMSTNLLVDNYVTKETSGSDPEIGYLTNIRRVNYSGNAGVGLVYHIQSHFSLHLEPRFRYFLHSINDQTLPATRPYSLGFFTGISYRF